MGKYSEEDFKQMEQQVSDGLGNFWQQAQESASDLCNGVKQKTQTVVNALQFGKEYADYKVNQVIVEPVQNTMQQVADGARQGAQDAMDWAKNTGEYISGKVSDGLDSYAAFVHENDASLSQWAAGVAHGIADKFDASAQRHSDAAQQSRENIEERNARYAGRALEGIGGSDIGVEAQLDG